MVANLAVLVLAGGKGTRMKSATPKPLHTIFGLPLLAHILQTADTLKPSANVVLCGHQADVLKQTVKENYAKWGIKAELKFALQKVLNGSGSAVKYAMPALKNYKQVIILAGDAPLIEADTLKQLVKYHNSKKASCTVLTVEVPNPKGYGRIVKENNFVRIVEESETDAKTAPIKEVNSGMYIFEIKDLASVLKLLKPQGPKQEYYLTDTLALLQQKGKKVEIFKAADYKEAMGINSKKQLAEAAQAMREKINNKLMDEGVILIDPQSTYIDKTVKIGADSVIYPNCYIYGKTVIGENCKIGPNCWIENSKFENNVEVKMSCYILDSHLKEGAQTEPFAKLRPQTVVENKAKIGSFVEIKKSVIGKGSKVPHLSYIGDTVMGAGVNIGAGAITCNYDGEHKHQTIIGDDVFVGSNTNFVAPVKVGAGAKIGAGSTITEDIPAKTLAIARARQVNLKNKKGK